MQPLDNNWILPGMCLNLPECCTDHSLIQTVKYKMICVCVVLHYRKKPVWNNGCLRGGINQTSQAWQPWAMLPTSSRHLFPIPVPTHPTAPNQKLSPARRSRVLVWQRTAMHLPTSGLYGHSWTLDRQDTLMGTWHSAATMQWGSSSCLQTIGQMSTDFYF